jgi:hypothetical protein
MGVGVNLQALRSNKFGPILVNHGSSGWHWSGMHLPAPGCTCQTK